LADKICGGYGVLAFGTEEFWTFVLFNPEVKVCGTAAGCSSSSPGVSGGGPVRGVIDGVIVMVPCAVIAVFVVLKVIPGVSRDNVNIVASSSGHY
jgi:hypothetical protein